MIYITTTKLSEKLSIDKRQLFTKFNEWGWIERKNDKWVLTDLGRGKGGQVRSAPETGEFVVWPENISVNIDETVNEDKEGSDLTEVEEPSEKSEGEEYIAEYFDAIEIEYRRQHVIEGLDDEYANYRVADFYLPGYKVMVEFAGRWNRSEEERERYRHKKEVFKGNGIACLWIYPDNLGVLHYIFHKRLESVLGNHGFEQGLRSYRLKQFWKQDIGNFLGVAVGLLLLFYGVTPWEQNTVGVWISIGIIHYNLYHIISDLNSIRKGKSIKISRLNKWEE